MNKHLTTIILKVAITSSIATFAFADGSAPVYDADNFSPQQVENPTSLAENDISIETQSQPQSQPVPEIEAPSKSAQQKISRLEQQLNNLQSSNSSAHINALQNEVQSLRGQVEELTHQLQQLQGQVRTNYADLDKRMNHQQEGVKQSSEPAKSIFAKNDTKENAKQSNQPNVAEEQQIYQTAYNYIKAKKYNDAVTALQGMLKKYPSGQFAANAHYWLGELYGLMNKNDQSLAEFGIVVKNYPDSPKVSDAQLKLGLLYAAQANWSEAKSSLKKVINKYPGSTSARVASEQLKQIKLAGH